MMQIMVNPIVTRHMWMMTEKLVVNCEFLNSVIANDFGEFEIVNEHMHAWVSHHRVDENYVDINFDEEQLTGDEWLHMMQQKQIIEMLLFGEISPLFSRIQVENNLFVATNVGKNVGNEYYHATTEEEKTDEQKKEE